ncbi:hypothetical protein M422DRAFT_781191 [Sphaerobolus stellatus SS14]|uniref:Uncharacterized protein n=1 Tax=Sphaerobolus stellatus (strain SS14) TaxID=990650 RepID=A0A0C9UW32_SPHS4|nr:hypothetical protein M422DRAFT_781191 [Sphaerobolus stellatus SS14]
MPPYMPYHPPPPPQSHLPPPPPPPPPAAAGMVGGAPVPMPVTMLGFVLDPTRWFLLGQMDSRGWAAYPSLLPPHRPLGPSFPSTAIPVAGSSQPSTPTLAAPQIPIPIPAPPISEASIQLVRDVMSLSSILEMDVERDKVRLRDGKWVNFMLPGTVESDVPDSVPQHQLPPPPLPPHSYPGQYGGPPGYGGEFYPPPQQGPGMHMGGMGPPPGMESIIICRRLRLHIIYMGDRHQHRRDMRGMSLCRWG